MKIKFSLLIALLLLLLFAFVNFSKKASSPVVDNQPKDNPAQIVESTNPTSSPIVADEIELDEPSDEVDYDDFSESAECKEFKKTHAIQYREYQELFEQIGLNNHELINETAFNTLSLKSLNDLALSGNHKAKYVLGITHIWQGGLGIDYFAMAREQDESEEEKELRFERIRNHQLNHEQVLKGQELLFEASVNGKYFGLIELFNGQGFVINKLSKQKDKTGLKSELLKYLNIVELIDYVFEKESKSLMLSDTYYRKDKALENILNIYGEHFNALQIDSDSLIKESDGSQLIERWKHSRIEAGYLETKFNVDERVSDFATELSSVCGLWSII